MKIKLQRCGEYAIFAVPLHIQNDIEMGRKILHVEFNKAIDGERHYYFGSKAAIFQRFTAEQVGITYYSLKNISITKEEPYVNRQCTIRQGELIASETKTKEGKL